MTDYLAIYCKQKKYIIDGNKITKEGKQIGKICYLDKIVTLGNNKYKFGDFALAILDGYCDLYDGGEYVDV
tara:strand:+ start:493 stop:705 length:213 start_codon:yes stop_codon:yes gene_type:complete